MKRLLILSLILNSYILPSFAQNSKTIAVDSTVSVKIPFAKTLKKDKQFDISAETGFGNILVFTSPDELKVTPDIERDKHLMKYYKKYINSIANSTEGKIIEEKDALLGELKVKDFTLETDTGSGKMLRSFRIMHANNKTYTFEFLYKDINREYAIPERDQFFNSITVTEKLNRKDQYTTAAINAANGGDHNYTIWMIAGGVFLIMIVVFVIVRKRKTA